MLNIFYKANVTIAHNGSQFSGLVVLADGRHLSKEKLATMAQLAMFDAHVGSEASEWAMSDFLNHGVVPDGFLAPPKPPMLERIREYEFAVLRTHAFMVSASANPDETLPKIEASCTDLKLVLPSCDGDISVTVNAVGCSVVDPQAQTPADDSEPADLQIAMRGFIEAHDLEEEPQREVTIELKGEIGFTHVETVMVPASMDNDEVEGWATDQFNEIPFTDPERKLETVAIHHYDTYVT